MELKHAILQALRERDETSAPLLYDELIPRITELTRSEDIPLITNRGRDLRAYDDVPFEGKTPFWQQVELAENLARAEGCLRIEPNISNEYCKTREASIQIS